MVQASAYGKCVVADYQSVHKDMCATEFRRLKDCYLVGYASYYGLGAIIQLLIYCAESIKEALSAMCVPPGDILESRK